MRIIYLDIDSLRPDHLGCYGYHRNTSPNIDRLAAMGLRFDNYYCSDAPCLPSRTALYTGMFGIHSGVVGHGGTAADLLVEGPQRGFRDRVEVESLPSRLQQAGFHTAQISPFGQRHAARQFYAGFNEIHNTGKGGMESAEEVMPVVDKWLEDNGRKDQWFLHLNLWDPHTPIRVPHDYACPFRDDPLPEWLTPEVLAQHQSLCRAHGALDVGMYTKAVNAKYPRELSELANMDDLRDWINGYDTAVRYADDQVGKILDFLEANKLLDDTLIMLTADHGENQGELGIYGEHGTADQITCRVPMIMHWPGKVEAGVHKGLQYQIDLAPTLADLIGFAPSPCWDGKSYRQSLEDPSSGGRDYLVLSQCAHVCQRSVRFDKWLYIRTIHCGYNLFPTEMLFDIEADPHEQTDLAAEHPGVCDAALRRLHEWEEEQMRSAYHPIDPLWTVMSEGGPFHARGQLNDFFQHLESTGREHYIDELKARYPGEY